MNPVTIEEMVDMLVGYSDGSVSREEALEIAREIVRKLEDEE